MDVDNNVVEHYNAKIAKFIGGKRVNFTLKNSHSSRFVVHNYLLVIPLLFLCIFECDTAYFTENFGELSAIFLKQGV